MNLRIPFAKSSTSNGRTIKPPERSTSDAAPIADDATMKHPLAMASKSVKPNPS